MQDFTKLTVWQRSHRLTLTTYGVTAAFPREERYGLTQQIRRAASSVEFNIAEGSGCRSKRAFLRYLGIAAASLSELQCQLILARDLGWLDDEAMRRLIGEIIGIRRMLLALMRSLGTKPRERVARTFTPSTESERRRAPRSDGAAPPRLQNTNGVA